MTSLSRQRPRTKPARKDLVVSLVIAIDHQVYELHPITGISDPDVVRAWRLAKRGADGAVYDVAERIDGAECTCPDYEVRRRGLDPSGCKHVKALRAVGLIEHAGAGPAAVITAPPEAPAAVPPERRPGIDRVRDEFDDDATPTAPAPVEPEPESFDVSSDPASWPEWVDRWWWEPGPEPEPTPSYGQPQPFTSADLQWAAREFGSHRRGRSAPTDITDADHLAVHQCV